MREVRLTRADAALLLGVPVDVSPDVVRHAWRMWARIAHPDAGGDPAHFAQLERARRVLLIPLSVAPSPAPQRQRHGLREVLKRPSHPLLLALAVLSTVGMIGLTRAGQDASSLLVLALTALPGALAAAGVAAWVAHELLAGEADRGHRIIVTCGIWLPVVCAQLLLAACLGSSLVQVLPLFALPIAAIVASMDPGVGLWRPLSQRTG